MSGQSIVDRLNAAKHTVAGSALGRAVVKATTEEIMGPKRKHLDYLLQCTSEINVSIPQMADLLIERTQNTSWVVTFKALITIHHLMCFGNERFSQYMASHSSKFTLNNFMDRTGAQGIDMSSYIRKYAFYLNEKRETYKLMGFDFCKVKRGKDDGLLRTMNTEKLLKTLPVLQKQLDALIQFDVQPNELTNGVINACFVLLSKDLIRLFACYNDGIINLLEKFFDMNKKNCREALEIYKKFLERTDNVAAFLKVAESSGMDKSDIPDLTKAPSSLLEALEAHVNGLEGKKGTNGTTSTATSKASSAAVNNAINSLNSNTHLSAEEKRRIVEEEAKTLEAFKSNHLKRQTSISSPTSELGPPPVLSHVNTPTPQQQTKPSSSSSDLFGLDLTGAIGGGGGIDFSSSSATVGKSAGDDLLQLSGANPFIQNIVNQSYAAPPMMANPFQAGGMSMAGMQPMGMYQQPMGNPMKPLGNNQPNDLFESAAWQQQQQQDDQVASSSSFTNIAAEAKSEFDAFGDVLKPLSNDPSLLNSMNKQSNGSLSDKTQEAKLFSKDLDSSLAQLADNLDINNKNKTFGAKNHQWNPNQPNSQAKTGGQNWKPGQPAAPVSGAWGATPMVAPMAAPAPMANPMMTGGAAWGMAPAPAAMGAMNPFGAPTVMGGAPMGAAPINPMMMQAGKPANPPQPSLSTANPFDLF